MSIVRKKEPVRVAIDSNIFISALIYGGKPAVCVTTVYEHKNVGFVSDPIITEVLDVLARKFNFRPDQLEEVRELIELNFSKVYPEKTLNIARDSDDNRVLEAALAGDCHFIITGDQDLLDLKKFKSIIILPPSTFLSHLS